MSGPSSLGEAFQKLHGRKFIVRTDHSSLRYLMNFKNHKEQFAWWIEVMSSYDLKVEHLSRRLHSNGVISFCDQWENMLTHQRWF